MRIIKEGDFSRTAFFLTFECERCGCEFAATSEEYSEERELNSVHGWMTIITCPCPCCGIKVTR